MPRSSTVRHGVYGVPSASVMVTALVLGMMPSAGLSEAKSMVGDGHRCRRESQPRRRE